MKKTILLLSIILTLFFSCRKPETLKEAYEDYFYIGAAGTSGAYMSQPVWKMYDEEIMKNFNMLVAENAMKPEAVANRNPDKYNFTYSDPFVEYAEENGMAVRGHVLIWHDQSPGFLASPDMSREQAEANLRTHIETVMGHYKGRIYSWDVVNEAINDNGPEVYRTSSAWYQAYGGPEFIADAFRVAREMDPDAKLIYNDYNVVVPRKREKIIRMIEELDLIEAGMTGVGFQAHWNLEFPSTALIKETIDAFAELGLEVSITELDIDCYNGDVSAPEREYDDALAKELADRYGELFEAFREKGDYIDAVVFWGVADDHSWLHRVSAGRPLPQPRTNYPLLFDWFGEPKEAYYAVMWF